MVTPAKTQGAQTAPDDMPKVGSLIAKMQIYNMNEASFRHALRAASDDGIDPRHHGAMVDYLRRQGMDDAADYVHGIGESAYESLLRHFGAVQAEDADGDGDEIEQPIQLPTDHEIMAAMLDAFEQESNICEKKRLMKWLNDNGHDNVGAWLETLNRADFFKLLGSFFRNLGAMREKAAHALAASAKEESLTEQAPAGIDPSVALDVPGDAPGDAATSDAEPDAAPDAAPDADAEPSEEPPPTADAEKVHPIVMDMYLEGIDITRRAALVKEMQKAGHDEEAQYIESLSLGAYYNLLADFFRGLGKTMGEAQATERRTDMDVQQRTWDSMSAEDRELALTDGGLSHGEARRAASKDWQALSHREQEAFGASLKALTERKRAEISLPGRRKKMNKAFAKIESPEELLPAEVQEALDLMVSFTESFGITEAAKRASSKMGKSKGMPQKLISKLEVYLGKAMKEAMTECGDMPPAAPASPAPDAAAPVAAVDEPKKKDGDDEDGKETEDASQKLAGKSVLGGKKKNEDEPAPEADPKKDEPEAEKKGEDGEEPKKDEPEGEKKSDEPKASEDDDAEKKDEPKDDEPKGDEEPKTECGDDAPEPEKKKDGDEDELAAMDEMLRLALGSTRMAKGGQTAESRRVAKAILIGESTSGTGGAPAAGVLDVFSYGSYLEKTLPYLIAATTSRMAEEDKQKFVNTFRKFVETNDLVQLTELSGKLASVVEYADATQEGAELVKTFRFMSDFLNMMRASVDYTKKALS